MAYRTRPLSERMRFQWRSAQIVEPERVKLAAAAQIAGADVAGTDVTLARVAVVRTAVGGCAIQAIAIVNLAVRAVTRCTQTDGATKPSVSTVARVAVVAVVAVAYRPALRSRALGRACNLSMLSPCAST